MDERAARVADLTLHKDARDRIKDRARWFTEALTAQSKLIAEVNGHNIVIAKDVDEAMGVFFRERRPRSYLYDAGVAFGGVLLGVGVPYFITEMSRDGGPRPTYTVAFAILTVLGTTFTIISATAKR